MSQLPEPGDVRHACDVWNDRIHAVADGGDSMAAGAITITESGAVGEGVQPVLRAAGDLFDPSEMFAYAGAEMIDAAIEDVLRDGDVRSALATVIIQSTALGVIMERARWERQR